MDDTDSQVQESSHSDELREPVKLSRKRTKAPDGRGRHIDDVPSQKSEDEAAGVANVDVNGSPGVRKSSS